MKIEYWCNMHRRPAPPEGWGKYIDGRTLQQCTGGGILLPCVVINCEEVGIEIELINED